MLATLGAYVALIFAPMAFARCDRHLKNPEDEFFIFGNVLLGRRSWRKLLDPEMKTFLLGWAVKAFFAPLMLGFLAGYVETLSQIQISLKTFPELFFWSIAVFYCLDTVFGLAGYLLASRWLDAHIRSVDATFLGWAAALACYPPFNYLWRNFVHYSDAKPWHEWFSGMPILGVSWGFGILILTGVYAWATAAFGCRFSNLTNRGIIWHGPYRWVKHPAYLCKNLSWWLMYLPFIGFGKWQDCLGATVLLVIMNGIYFLRAKTEEWHLMRDLEYREYCAWVEKRGLWAHVRRRVLGPDICRSPDSRNREIA